MRNLGLIMMFCLFATNVFAISNEDLVQKCLEVGTRKIEVQANAWGCSVDLTKVEVQDIDNRFFNPSKYVWYQVLGECNGDDRIIKLVQYYNGKCF